MTLSQGTLNDRSYQVSFVYGNYIQLSGMDLLDLKLRMCMYVSITTFSSSSRWTVLLSSPWPLLPLLLPTEGYLWTSAHPSKLWELEVVKCVLGTWPDSNECYMLDIKYLYMVPLQKMWKRFYDINIF